MADVSPISQDPELYLTRKQVAARLGIGLTTLDRFVREGMPSHRWGVRLRRFRFSEVERWLHERDRVDKRALGRNHGSQL